MEGWKHSRDGLKSNGILSHHFCLSEDPSKVSRKNTTKAMIWKGLELKRRCKQTRSKSTLMPTNVKDTTSKKLLQYKAAVPITKKVRLPSTFPWEDSPIYTLLFERKLAENLWSCYRIGLLGYGLSKSHMILLSSKYHCMQLHEKQFFQSFFFCLILYEEPGIMSKPKCSNTTCWAASGTAGNL